MLVLRVNDFQRPDFTSDLRVDAGVRQEAVHLLRLDRVHVLELLQVRNQVAQFGFL